MSKKLIGSEEFAEKEKAGRVPAPLPPLILTQDCPCVVDTEEFQYMYRCKHCGHEWSEVREKEEIGRARDYTGD